jgi:two-component system cell cycle response regulator
MLVLIVDAGSDSRQALEDKLAGWGYQVAGVGNLTEARTRLAGEKNPGMIILASVEPPDDRLRFIQEIRQQRVEPYSYILVCLPPDQAADIKAVLDAGADDYLTNASKPQELKARVRAGRRIVQLREELFRARETIRYQLHHDPLTGVWNRAAIIEILHRELARVRRDGTHVGVIMAALDGLKGINDAYGHAAGDQVVRVAARRMRSSLRPYDEIGRYAGGVFLMVVPGSSPRNALKQAERLQLSISAQPMEIPPEGKPAPGPESHMSVTISVGVTVGTKQDQADALIRGAEEATERAKSGGANRIEQVASPHAILSPEDFSAA